MHCPVSLLLLTSDIRLHRSNAVADHVVCQLKGHGDPWHLGDEANRGDAPTT